MGVAAVILEPGPGPYDWPVSPPIESKPDAAARPVLAVTMGDPGGIGPEVVVKALAEPALRRSARFRVLGPALALERAAERAGIEPYWWKIDHASDLVDTTTVHEVVVLDYGGEDVFPAQANRSAGELSFRLVEDAIALAKREPGDPLRVDGLVTGPINKQAWSMAGHGRFPGHTELLALRFGAKRSAMFFHAPPGENAPHGLNVILATVHLPLMEIRNILTIGRVFDAIDLGHGACRALGVGRPRIAVAGLNPHAGEGGVLGDEETRLIEPAIRLAQDQGMDVRGPYPGDTVFNAAVRGQFDLVVAMYHDQGLIPLKLLARDTAVNMTVGLPIPRTSPDHGTAFDIAGRNQADPGSMRAACEMALRLS